ncbi:hypothetical protein [uncultured Thiodictyon sp.]|uniref:hypothetical protein n=1 Tax=uncultured Thiodictyon sp. TaxID=1846217 RepID=UPI0025F6A480|nr:hypothetical protein [uncultured Thiodictyon sp.]
MGLRVAEEGERLLKEGAEVADAGGGLVAVAHAHAGCAGALVVEAPVEIGIHQRRAVRVPPVAVDEAGLQPLDQQRRLADPAPGDDDQRLGAVGPGLVQPGQIRVATQEVLGLVAEDDAGGGEAGGGGEGRDDGAQVAQELAVEVALGRERSRTARRGSGGRVAGGSGARAGRRHRRV